MNELTLNIPSNLENMRLPSPELLDYYNRLDNRIILINDIIDDYVIDYSMKIMEWNQEDKNFPIEDRIPIKIFINSDGGSVGAVLNLIDTISLSKTPVYTIGMDRCYSSGGMLLMSGHKRFIYNHTTYLVHDGYTGSQGSTGKMLDNLEFTKILETKVKNYILTHSSINEDLYERNYRKDWFMFADEIIKYNIADKIVTSLDEIV